MLVVASAGVSRLVDLEGVVGDEEEDALVGHVPSDDQVWPVM